MKNLYNIFILIVLLFTSQSSNSQDDILKKINEIATLEQKVMMPMRDGIRLATDIYRPKTDKKVPIIFLTAKSMKEDTLKGFEIGADDYITKPFNMEELTARISAILKRVSSDTESHFDDIKIGKLTFNPKMQILSKDDFSVSLTTKESDLLILLHKNKNEILERDHALKAIWGDDNYFNGRSMDVYITKLRKYLNQDEKVEIVNIHGKGFKLMVK